MSGSEPKNIEKRIIPIYNTTGNDSPCGYIIEKWYIKRQPIK